METEITPKKKRILWIVEILIGSILLILQIISIAGNLKVGRALPSLYFTSFPIFIYTLGNVIGYYIVGTCGFLFIVLGVITHKEESRMGNDKKEGSGSLLAFITGSIFIIIQIIAVSGNAKASTPIQPLDFTSPILFFYTLLNSLFYYFFAIVGVFFLIVSLITCIKNKNGEEKKEENSDDFEETHE